MRRQIFFLVTLILSCLVAIETSNAGTIPAGTALVVETLNSIYTKDAVGKEFTAQLEQDLVVKGSVVARAGTRFIGKIESSTKMGSSPLTVNLTGSVSVEERFLSKQPAPTNRKVWRGVVERR